MPQRSYSIIYEANKFPKTAKKKMLPREFHLLTHKICNLLNYKCLKCPYLIQVTRHSITEEQLNFLHQNKNKQIALSCTQMRGPRKSSHCCNERISLNKKQLLEKQSKRTGNLQN